MISVKFGLPILEPLLEQANLKALVRAHQQKDLGYKLHMWHGNAAEPPLITIFSAPNYCGHENFGAIMITGQDEEEKTKILIYAEQEYYKPFFFPRLDTDDPK